MHPVMALSLHVTMSTLRCDVYVQVTSAIKHLCEATRVLLSYDGMARSIGISGIASDVRVDYNMAGAVRVSGSDIVQVSP